MKEQPLRDGQSVESVTVSPDPFFTPIPSKLQGSWGLSLYVPYRGLWTQSTYVWGTRDPEQPCLSPLTIQLHCVEGLIPKLQLCEDDGVVLEVSAQHPIIQHANS